MTLTINGKPAPLILAEPVIRLAEPAERDAVMALCRELHAENGQFPLAEDKVQATLDKAFNKDGGILGVIGPPGNIQAAMLMILSSFWYTDEWHLEELFSFVRADCRKMRMRTSHAKLLISWAMKCADELKLKLFIGVISNERTEAKVRLYRRQLQNPAGAFFIYGPRNHEAVFYGTPEHAALDAHVKGTAETEH